MEFEYWQLILIPALFLAGWWCRGIDARQHQNSNERQKNYVRATSLLISGQTDKAIDAFVEVVRLDPEQLELYHSLGKLFRERGEFERAIRLHRHIFNRDDLPREERTLALKELAEDYFQAGLFDRAEAAFRRLSTVPSEHLFALRHLLKIYVIEHEWASATEVARLLESQAGESHHEEIAHFYCERIEVALKRHQYEEAQALVNEVLPLSDATPRVGIVGAQVALSLGDTAKGVELLESVAQQFPAYVPLFVGQLADAKMKLGEQTAALTLLSEVATSTHSIDAMEAAMVRYSQWKGPEYAKTEALKFLKQQPTLTIFSHVMQLRAQSQSEDNEETTLLANTLKQHARRLSRFQCAKCGFLASSFSWHCLGCGAWDSFPPRRIEERRQSGSGGY